GRGRRPRREPLVDGEVRPGSGERRVGQDGCRTQRRRDVVWAAGHGLPRSTAVARTYSVRPHAVTAAPCAQRARIAVAVGLAGRGRRPGREPLVDVQGTPAAAGGEARDPAGTSPRAP